MPAPRPRGRGGGRHRALRAQRGGRGCRPGVPRATHPVHRHHRGDRADPRGDRGRAGQALRGSLRRGRQRARTRPPADRGSGGRVSTPLGLAISGAGPWLLVFAGFISLIVLHEFGHFVVAKWTGMRVERFFLFFPPKLVSVRRGETEYGIGMIPLGGFVKITGMNPEELEPEQSREETEAG